MAGERVLDIATGTGNAALAAARAGARATGIDAAPRVVEVARQRAASERLEVSFEVGDLHELPFASGSFDCAISVFEIIFAADPPRAVGELMRVATAPLLEHTGNATSVCEEALAVLRAANERGDGFLVTSPYRVIEVR